MKNNLVNAILFGIVLFAVWVISGARYEFLKGKQLEQKLENQYSQTLDTRDDLINTLKKDLEKYRVENMTLQTKLDSCEFDIPKLIAVSNKITKPGRPKVSYKDKYDSTSLALLKTKDTLKHYKVVYAKCDNDIIWLRDNLEKCQEETQHVSKALEQMTNHLIDETTKVGILTNKLSTPIQVYYTDACLNAKGVISRATVYPDSSRTNVISTISFKKSDKTLYKTNKKACKNSK